MSQRSGRVRFRRSPRTFRVEELPLYPASGDGEHLWLAIQKRGIDTFQARKRLAGWFETPERDIGYAGLKDAAAVTMQTLSLPARGRSPQEALVHARRFASPQLRVASATLHRNRLRVGQLAGNRFRCLIEGTRFEQAAALAARLRRLAREGFPNHFGPQRWGSDGGNIERGRKILSGEWRGRRDRARLWLSALQSFVFERVLQARLKAGFEALDGDWLVPTRRRSRALSAMMAASPGDPTSLRRGWLAPSGPLPGYRSDWAQGSAGELERRMAKEAGWPEELPRRVSGVRLDGARRPLRVYPWNVASCLRSSTVILEFDLPPGSYATVLVAELLAGLGLGKAVELPEAYNS